MGDPVRGIYVEPLSVASILLGDDTAGVDPLQRLYLATQRTLMQRVSPMLVGSGYEADSFSVLFLSQQSAQHCCSDNVIGLLTHIASPEFDLGQNLLSLTQLQYGHLSEYFFQLIRMLQIDMHGLDYFKLQLRTELTDEEIKKATALFLQNKEANSIRWLEREIFGEDVTRHFQKHSSISDVEPSSKKVKTSCEVSVDSPRFFSSPLQKKPKSQNLLKKVLMSTSLAHGTLPPQYKHDPRTTEKQEEMDVMRPFGK